MGPKSERVRAEALSEVNEEAAACSWLRTRLAGIGVDTPALCRALVQRGGRGSDSEQSEGQSRGGVQGTANGSLSRKGEPQAGRRRGLQRHVLQGLRRFRFKNSSSTTTDDFLRSIIESHSPVSNPSSSAHVSSRFCTVCRQPSRSVRNRLSVAFPATRRFYKLNVSERNVATDSCSSRARLRRGLQC